MYPNQIPVPPQMSEFLTLSVSLNQRMALLIAVASKHLVLLKLLTCHKASSSSHRQVVLKHAGLLCFSPNYDLFPVLTKSLLVPQPAQEVKPKHAPSRLHPGASEARGTLIVHLTIFLSLSQLCGGALLVVSFYSLHLYTSHIWRGLIM